MSFVALAKEDWRLIKLRFLLPNHPCRLDRVRQQARNRHWSDAAGDGGDGAGALGGLGEGDVADDALAAVRECLPVDAHVDDDRAFLDPFLFHEFRLADGGDHDVGAFA